MVALGDRKVRTAKGRVAGETRLFTRQLVRHDRATETIKGETVALGDIFIK